MPLNPRFVPYTVALLLSLAACHTQPQGSAVFAASVSQALSASDVTRVTVTVSAADMASISVNLTKSNGTWGGVIGNIPAGTNRSFVAEAFDSSNTKRFEGQASGVTISANQTTAVAITMQETSPRAPYGNEAPFIDSAVANPTSVPTGGSVSLTSTAHDPNLGDPLTYAWTATAGTFSNATSANTSWTAPASTGIQTLTLTVTDSQGAAVSVSLSVNVVTGATGSAELNISFNLWPVISRLTSSLNRLDVGQATSVSANASDADGDSLSYQWSASCPGTWTNPSSSNVSFVPSSLPAGSCNNCKLTVIVQDGRGGQTSGSINLCVTSPSVQRFPPAITNYYQSAISTTPGQTLGFDVTALDPQSSAMTFTWIGNTGSLGTAQSTANTSHISWTAPSCVPAGVTSSVTATVTNAYGLMTSQVFTVSGVPACAASAFTAATQSATSISPGQTVTFDVTTSDPQSSAMTFAWSANTGLLATAQSTATTSHMVWTAPSCVLTGITPTVTAVVTNAFGLSTSKAFTVSGLPGCGASGWSSAGTMAVARWGHTVTLLSSGKALVAGGTDGSADVAGAQLYDPVANTWSSANSMTSRRERHTATLLSSGKVLVAGGHDGSGALASAELYDPATNSWSPTGPMATGRYTHTATLLSSGKVLVTGGNYPGILASAELYDPATNTWSPAGTMAAARQDHTATLLSSGKVLVVGGNWPNGLASAELYDPATNTWSSVGTMAAARDRHIAVRLPSGKVLVAGSVGGLGHTTAELFDPGTNTWSSTSTMTSGREFPGATLLPSGKVLVSGGGDGNSTLISAELYDPATNTWSSTLPMSQARWGHTSTLLSSGRALVVGGTNNPYATSNLAAAERYTP